MNCDLNNQFDGYNKSYYINFDNALNKNNVVIELMASSSLKSELSGSLSIFNDVPFENDNFICEKSEEKFTNFNLLNYTVNTNDGKFLF